MKGNKVRNSRGKVAPTGRLAAVMTSVAVAALGLVGIGTAAHAAPGEIDFDETGSITVHKLTQPAIVGDNGTGEELANLPTGAEPIDGIKFSVTPVTGIDLEDSAQWAQLASMTVDQARAKGVGTAQEATTANGGVAEFSNLPVGVYIVEEGDATGANVAGKPVSVDSAAAPWLVVLPLQVNDAWLYNIHVYPKNAVDTLVKTEAGAEGLGIGSVVKWNITAKLPSLSEDDVLNGYSVTDTLDDRLEYSDVTDVTYDGAALAPGNYDVDVDDSGASTVVTFSLTNDGVAAVSANSGKVLSFTLKTTVVSLGEDGSIQNDASSLTNTNNGVSEISAKGGGATTNWGAAQILKTDKGDVPLSGAKFKVYASLADANNDANPINVGGKTEFESAANGIVSIPGLYVGDGSVAQRSYYVKESVAPAGYVKLDTPQEIVVVPSGADNPVQIKVINTAYGTDTLPKLPLTGAAGAGLFLVAGGLLVAGAVALRVRRRASSVND